MPTLDNPKWELFCQNIARHDMKAYEAYMKAGFNAKKTTARNRGAQLRKRPEILARITEIQLEVAESFKQAGELDEAYVLRELKMNHERALKGTPVFDRSGNHVGDRQDIAGSNTALKMIGQKLGMFADRLEIAHLDERLDRMSTDEIIGFVTSLASDVGMRVVAMNDEENREYIRRVAPRVGLFVLERDRADALGLTAGEGEGVPAVSEAARVPSTRIQ